MDIHAYAISDRPGALLCVGVPQDRTRPALWIQEGDEDPVVLAQFHGEKHAQVAINYLDTMVGAINRAIAHHTGESGE